jgi:PAS domain S-box-containing protein
MLAPLKTPYYFEFQYDLLGWITWVVLFIVIIYGVARSIDSNLHWGKRAWFLLAILTAAVFITTPFFGVNIPINGVLPRPERPDIPSGPPLMFLSALPWMLAAGFLGVLPAAFLGALSGFLLGYMGTHSIFTPVEMAAIALLASLMMRQRYRTFFYRILRHPLGTAVLLIAVYAVLSLITLTVSTPGLLVSRVDYALTNLESSVLAFGAEIVIAGLVAEVFALSLPGKWGRQELFQPSPSEIHLQIRFFSSVAPLLVALILLVIVGDWFISQREARQILQTQLASTAKMAADGMPFFLENGQTLIESFTTNQQLQSRKITEINAALQELQGSIPFFRQLSVLDQKGDWLAGYPVGEVQLLEQSPEEDVGIDLALKGVGVQTYSVEPVRGEKSAQVAFIVAIPNVNGSGIAGVLWGRADLASNPYTQPVLKAIDSVSSLDGEGLIINEKNQILYSSSGERMMETYNGQAYTTPRFFDQTGSSGMRELVYYQPTTGQPWAVILKVPARQVQQLALNTAVPLFCLIILFAGIASLILYLVLRKVTASLVTLADTTLMMTQGELDHPLPATLDVDEVGQLSKAFEQMRIGLKSRLDELNRLLEVSQGVASSLEITETVQPILKAALSSGASISRVVLVEETVSGADTPAISRFSQGPEHENYTLLDGEILNLARQRDLVVLNNLYRGRGLRIPANAQHPTSLAAVPLRHENQFYGVLWVGYPEVHPFTEEETRFLSTLGVQAALAAANYRLYAASEIGRQRLEAVLVSTPDPIFVTDQQNRLLIANPAFFQLPGLAESTSRGQQIQEVIGQKELLDLTSRSNGGEPTREIRMTNGRIYFVTTSAVKVDQHSFGKIFILRDITHYKEVDSLKSEFVATVSHDLRSPLTLMRGYATMLPLVGDMNEQQKSFVRRIMGGIDNMSRLVSNLLDLGRIEAGIGLKLEKVSPSEIVERVTGLLQLQAAQKNLHYEVLLPEKKNAVIIADPALLQQALYNLVENAIKYTPIDGQVKVSLQVNPENVMFSVRDSGIGIAPLDQPRLFEKFYRGGQREGQPNRGSGLGLAIVKSIAEKHGGKVWLESQLGRGSAFFLEIPVTPPLELKIAV